MEQVSGVALWSSEAVFVDIEKTERGFGFSILDYQDPLGMLFVYTEEILIKLNACVLT